MPNDANAVGPVTACWCKCALWLTGVGLGLVMSVSSHCAASATSSSAELSESKALILAEFYCGLKPQWLIKAERPLHFGLEISPERMRAVRLAEKEVADIKRRHFVDLDERDVYAREIGAWRGYLSSRGCDAASITTAGLIREFNEYIQRRYGGVGLPVCDGDGDGCRLQGMVKLVSALHDVGLKVRLPRNLRGELALSFAALYKDEGLDPWRRFRDACNTSLAEPDPAGWPYPRNNQVFVYDMLSAVPDAYLDCAWAALADYRDIVADSWASTSYSDARNRLRSRRAARREE